MSSLMEGWPRKHRITVEEYYRMADVGLLAPDARVELIEGEIIDMAPMGSDHASVLNRLARLLFKATDGVADVRIQCPVRLDPASEPEPDLAVVRLRPDDYRKSHPTADDVLLLVEVSDSTLRYDRDVKVSLYARHGIPEVWLVDLHGGELRWYRSPRDGTYGKHGATRDRFTLPIAGLPDATIDLSGLLQG